MECSRLGPIDAATSVMATKANRNNADKSSQRAHVVFLAEPRARSAGRDSRGALVEFESQKIERTVLSTTMSELYAPMQRFGSRQFLLGLRMGVSGTVAEIHMRTDANDRVTTASTNSPEQKETIHTSATRCTEARSGASDDIARVSAEFCLSDCLTKQSAKPDVLREAVRTSVLKEVDARLNFRTLLRHRARLSGWRGSTLQVERAVS